MSFLSTALYYVCFASVILIYGIGTNNALDFDSSKIKNFTFCTKIFISILISSILSWFITRWLLVPLKLTELYPLVCFLIFILINAFLEALVRLTTGKSATEFVFSYLVIILSVSESTSFLNTITISLSCVVSVVLLLPFIVAFKRENNKTNKENYYCRLFLYIAIVILIISVFDVLWFNPGVIK